MALLDRYGSFWRDRYRSQVPAAIVEGAGLYLRGQATPGSPGGEVKGVILSSADRVSGSAPDSRLVWGYPLDDDFVPTVIALSAVSGPVWTTGIDFYVDDRIWFYVDPLLEAAVAPKLSYSGGETSAVVWASAATPTPASVRARVGTYLALTEALAHVYDSPRFTVASEVESIETLYDGQVAVTTGAESFVLPVGATAAVAVGDTVTTGDPVGNAWRLVRLGPTAPTEPSVAVGLTALPTGLSAPLVWYNTPVATVVDDVGGRTRIRWPLGGSGADVTAFWAASHDAALAGRVSMANLLDLRAHPFGEPQVTDLPSVVTPAEVLCRVLVGGCGYMVLTVPAAYGPDALDAADRLATLRVAAGTSAGVFEFEGGVPTTPAVLP